MGAVNLLNKEQRPARSRCYRYVFVFEYLIYSSTINILYRNYTYVNNIIAIMFS